MEMSSRVRVRDGDGGAARLLLFPSGAVKEREKCQVGGVAFSPTKLLRQANQAAVFLLLRGAGVIMKRHFAVARTIDLTEEQEEDQHLAKKATPLARLFTAEHLKTLQRDGAVVIPGVMSPEECQAIHKQMLELNRSWNPALVPEKPSVWDANNRIPGVHGLCQFLGQEQFLWDVRQNERVARVFAEMHGNCKPHDLICSMDGYRFLLHGRNYKPGHWAHVDEVYRPAEVKPLPADFLCVQGSVAICSSEDDADGDFVFWRGSHRIHERYFKSKPELLRKFKTVDNWHRFEEQELIAIARDARPYLVVSDSAKYQAEPFVLERVRVRRPAGAMVLWYSRTIHMSDPPQPASQHDAAAVFVCYAPRSLALKGDLAKHIKLFETRRTSSHWPIAYLKAFSAKPRSFNAEQEQSNKRGLERLFGKSGDRMSRPVRLTALGRRLVGYEE